MREFQVIIDGVTYDVQVSEVSEEEREKSFIPMEKIEKKAQEVANQKAKAKAEPKAVSGTGTPLKAPMPGMILNLKVASGATVKKGQAVIGLEAMKMENDVAANVDGIISFTVQKGATVNTGDILAYIK